MITIRKHILLTTLLLLWATTGLVAQSRLVEPEIYIGVHGGVLGSMMNWAPKVAGTSKIEETALLSGNGGLVFRYSKHKCCAIQVELNYMQRGWREKIDGTDSQPGGTYVRKLDYIELPLLMHIYFGKPQCRGIFNLGPQIGYCVHESWSGVQHATEREQYQSLNHPFDWGIAGGLGVYYRHPKAGVFQLEARFNYSLGDAFSNGKMDYFDRSQAMNLSLNLGYFWQIRKPLTTH